MMYRDNFVTVIKSGGKVLRERNGCVMLPFGAEYSILLKNLDSRKAVVRVDVDGDNVIDGNRIIVSGNNSVELRGKMRGTKVKHRFKFIKKTREISRHRGDRPDDGLVRVEYWFEKRQSPDLWVVYPPIERFPIKPLRSCDDNWGITCGNSDGSSAFINNMTTYNCSTSVTKSSGPVGDDGLTVQGSKTRQDFMYGSTNTLESQSHVIIIQLRGKSKKGRVQKPITVKTRFRCPTCGNKSKSSAKWCHNCGTNLEM